MGTVHDPAKAPSDAKILRGFTQFEESLVIIQAALRHNPDTPDGDLDRLNDTFYQAHHLYRIQAIGAQERLDEKARIKEEKARAKANEN